MTSRNVLVEDKEGGVYIVRMNRPEKRNALDAQQWELITETISALAEKADIRCLVLTGAGSVFAAGGDISQFLREVSCPEGAKQFRARIHKCFTSLYSFPRPTVAMINGPAIGGGMELALACDVRVATDGATICMPAVKFGMVMAYHDFRRLAATVGPDRARFLAITGRVIGAAEAYRIGFVHEVVHQKELEDVTMKIATNLTEVDLQSTLWFRKAAEYVIESSSEGLSEFREFEERCLTSEAFRGRVERFLGRHGDT